MTNKTKAANKATVIISMPHKGLNKDEIKQGYIVVRGEKTSPAIE